MLSSVTVASPTQNHMQLNCATLSRASSFGAPETLATYSLWMAPTLYGYTAERKEEKVYYMLMCTFKYMYALHLEIVGYTAVREETKIYTNAYLCQICATLNNFFVTYLHLSHQHNPPNAVCIFVFFLANYNVRD